MLGYEQKSRIVREVVLGIPVPPGESAEAAAFRTGVARDARAARAAGQMLDLPTEWDDTESTKHVVGLTWDEAAHPRGETSPASTPGSFAPSGTGGAAGERTTTQDARRLYDEITGAWGRGLDKKSWTVRAMGLYSGHWYHGINNCLRHKDGCGGMVTPDATVRDVGNHLLAAFDDGVVLGRDVVVYRGLSGKHAKFKPGTVFSDKGFVSTSLDPNIASAFSNDVVAIHVPVGVRVLAPGAAGYVFAGEKEILLRSGSRFKITGRDEKNNQWLAELVTGGA